MSNPNLYVSPERAAHGTDAVLRLVAQYVDQLRQAFHQQAAARPDALDWHRLEYEVANLLECRFNDVTGPQPTYCSFWRINGSLSETVFDALREEEPSRGRLTMRP